MCERSLQHNEKVHTCYVDFEKAFDHINCVKLMTILQSLEIDRKDRKFTWNLYNGQKAYVRISEEQSDACVIGRGVRRGCSLSPLLYLIYDEAMVKEATYNLRLGVPVGGRVVNMIRYADDKAIECNNQNGLQELMNNLNRVT